MNHVHKLGNWSHMHLGGDSAFIYRFAPRDYQGVIYPPVTWDLISGAAHAVDRAHGIRLKCKPPQVWAVPWNNSDIYPWEKGRILGCVWEVCKHWENGDVSSDRVCALVAAMHEHLGPFYQDFLSER